MLAAYSHSLPAMRKILNIKKRYFIIVFFLFLLFILNIFKTPYVCYLTFDIPGKQMAPTIPPLGVFIESKYGNEKTDDKCSILTHELIHWE